MIDSALRIMTAPVGKTYIFSVGQAGYIIKSKSGQLLGIDMYLSNCVERVEGHIGFKRLLPEILAPSDLIFDCVIATHPHLDHFDQDAMPELVANNKTKLFASVNCSEYVIKSQLKEDNIIYVKPGDRAFCGDFILDFTNCDHSESAPDAVGVIITVDGYKIFEAGDTCLREDRVEEYLKEGPLDVMIAPINGAYGNLNEEECARLSGLLEPKLTIPCHYGMFASHGGDPGKFYEIMKNNYPERKFILMTQGEGIILQEELK